MSSADQTPAGDPATRPEVGATELPTPPDPGAVEQRKLKSAVRGKLFGTEEQPVKIGRFTVLKRVGVGGMGVVYSALDDELGRKVAIKLLRSEQAGAGSEGRARLLREAQAMAKLSHPNVIPVFEVGTHDGDVFLAMEYVQGQTAKEWLAEPRGYRKIIDVFVQAGRGLAAAHEAALIHRDFKPENVMVEASGRVRVLDFGLARPQLESTSETPDSGAAPEDESSTGQRGLLDSPLTQEGTIVGTPSYMAPEQYAHGEVDARSDQFSFCVALYEALYGERPFRGETFKELSVAVRRGEVEAEPADAVVPGWIRDVLLRGLSVEADARFAAMDDLLDALQRDPNVKLRRRLAVAAVPLAIVASLALGVVLADDESSVQGCTSPQEQLEGVWDEGRKQRIAGGLAESAGPGAASAWERVRKTLDAYAADWSSAYEAACSLPPDATEGAIAFAAEQRQCLDDEFREFSVFTDLVEAGDEGGLETAAEAARWLRRVERCQNERGIASRVVPPEDPELLREVMAIRFEISRAKRLSVLERSDEAQRVAQAAVDRARRSGHRPLEAEALLISAWSRWATASSPEIVALAEEAALVAESAGDDFTFAHAALYAAEVLAIGQAKIAEAEQWIRRAQAAHERLGNDREVSAQLAHTKGTVLIMQGKHEEGVAPLQQAVSLFEEVLGEDAFELTDSLNNLSVAQRISGDLEAAEKNRERHARLIEKHAGKDSPHLAYTLLNRANILMAQGSPEDALPHTLKALELVERHTPAKHTRYSIVLSFVGRNMEQLDRLEEALDYAQRAADAIEGLSYDPQAAYSLMQLASIQSVLGSHEEALRNAQRYTALLERQFSGEELAKDERYAHAIALAACEAVHVKKFELARLLAQRSLDLSTEHGAEEAELFLSRYALARALKGLGRDPKRVTALATAALQAGDEIERKGKKYKSKARRQWVADMQGWLESHAGPVDGPADREPS
jgi:tetratricopeptide (TPR) repeat protein/predicted Ser/Thr protein kinase